MKKIVRIVSFILVLVISVGIFSGCNALDEIKADQAFWVSDEKTRILFEGNEYVTFPENDLLQPVISNYDEQCIYVTEKDLPVLLSMFGEEFHYSDDKLFLVHENYYEDYLGYYCRADKYDEILTAMNSSKAEVYCYEYSMFNDYGEYITAYYVLNKEQKKAIDTVIETVEPQALLADAYIDYDYCIYLEGATKDLLFRNYFCDIYILDDKYFIETYDPETDICSVYTVPQDLNPVFKAIVSVYLDSEMVWEEEYYYDEDEIII